MGREAWGGEGISPASHATLLQFRLFYALILRIIIILNRVAISLCSLIVDAVVFVVNSSSSGRGLGELSPAHGSLKLWLRVN